jgi:hypothetical protein
MISVVGHHHVKMFQNETAPFQFEIFSSINTPSSPVMNISKTRVSTHAW